MLTYILFKTQSMLLSATIRKASQMLTYILFKTQGMLLSATIRKASQMLTYILFKTQGMLLSATSMKGQAYANLQPVHNQEDGLVSNKQEGSARC